MNGQLAGFLVIDKAEGMTSHEVVQVVRRQLQVTKAGHLGTLDPMATGVLPLAVGGATRLARLVMGGRKVYQGTIQLGFATDTYDRLGQPISEFRQPRFSPGLLKAVIEGMGGEQMQVPPPYSAKKIGGRRSYRLARRGIEVQIPPQRICIDRFKTWQGTSETIEFEIHCSPGTYVRSLAHELGQKLGCGAHLSRLRRLASGKFTLPMARQLRHGRIPEDWARSLLPMNSMLEDMPAVRISEEDQEHFAHGRAFSVTGVSFSSSPAPLIRILSGSGQLLGLAEVRCPPDAADGEDCCPVRLVPKMVL